MPEKDLFSDPKVVGTYRDAICPHCKQRIQLSIRPDGKKLVLQQHRRLTDPSFFCNGSGMEAPQ